MESKKLGDFLMLANGLVLIVLVNLVAHHYFFRIDLTEEKRYTIKEPTRELLFNLDDNVYIEVYLEGELNAEFKRFRNAIAETLEEFRTYSNNKIRYTFTDPSLAMSKKAQSEFIRDLAQKGITPTNVVERNEGETATRLIFPGAVVSYSGFETGIMLLKGNKASSSEEEINQSIEGVEYELASAIYKLGNTDRKRIGFITGHGELDSLEIAAFNNSLLEQFDVYKVDLSKKTMLQGYDAVIIAKPLLPFSLEDKYKLDQYIVNGGRMLLLLDKVNADMDSASRENYLALPIDVNLDDQLFKYGVRINYDLVEDRNAALYPVVTGQVEGKPKMQLLEWPYFPLINHYADHVITRNLDAVRTTFASSMDTVKAEGIKKTPLLWTSQYSRKVQAPVNVSIQEVMRNSGNQKFSTGNIAVGYMLEGKFTSLFKNRFLPEGVDNNGFKEQGAPGKVVIIADGDIARNDVNPRNSQPQPLGFDPFTNYTFANQDLLMNIMTFLTNEDGLIEARSKEIKIRPLDRARVKAEKIKWQLLNIILPLTVLVLYGVIRATIRKRKYARF